MTTYGVQYNASLKLIYLNEIRDASHKIAGKFTGFPLCVSPYDHMLPSCFLRLKFTVE